MKPSRASMGGYQGILIDWERGTLQGATESRNDGMALGTELPILQNKLKEDQ